MIKAILSYSKKIPVEGQDFSSQSYHLSLETELPDSLRQDEVRTQIHETFELVKRTVDAELSNGSTAERPGLGDPGSNNVPFAGNRRGSPAKATNKQIAYSCSLAENQGVSVTELTAHVGRTYNVDSLYDLTKADAARLIDVLKQGGLKAA